jgi:hypothetical protein
MSIINLIVIALVALLPAGQTSTVNLSFTPESEKFIDATKTYQAIWDADGARVIQAMEEVSGVQFGREDVKVIVYEGISHSGYKDTPMKLRASYTFDIKKATIVHELGHRLNTRIGNRPADVDEHRLLFLYLYDVWVKLYGKSFADSAVEVEKKRKGVYDYESAWNWALRQSAEERASRLKEIIAQSKAQNK